MSWLLDAIWIIRRATLQYGQSLSGQFTDRRKAIIGESYMLQGLSVYY